MNKSLVTVFIIIAYFVGLGVGFFLTPEYSAMSEERRGSSMSLGQPDRNLDLRYIDGMLAHHESALYMAKQAINNSSRSEIRELSHAIIKLDQNGIDRLYNMKKQLYNNSQKISQFQKNNLGYSDNQFDLRFLNAMIIHHEEAINVSREVLTKSYRTEILNEANNTISFLTENENQLKQWRETWYGI